MFRRCAVVVPLALILAVALAAKPCQRYTVHNLWYQSGTFSNSMSNANIPAGRMIPAGSKVCIETGDSGGGAGAGVAFDLQVILSDGTKIPVEYHDDWTGMGPEAWAAKITSDLDPRIEWEGWSEEDRLGISTGEVVTGMSRAAVFVAVGFPLKSKNKDPGAATLHYPKDADRDYTILFDEDKVMAVQQPEGEGE